MSALLTGVSAGDAAVNNRLICTSTSTNRWMHPREPRRKGKYQITRLLERAELALPGDRISAVINNPSLR